MRNSEKINLTKTNKILTAQMELVFLTALFYLWYEWNISTSSRWLFIGTNYLKVIRNVNVQVCVPQALLPSSTLNNIPGNSAFVQQNFRPQPQSTFIPVEPAKDTQVDQTLQFFYRNICLSLNWLLKSLPNCHILFLLRKKLHLHT